MIEIKIFGLACITAFATIAFIVACGAYVATRKESYEDSKEI